ncbi:hypothetical protein Q5P01_015837 [Channa striata]|uniref:PID domain-containing protein n=1 Tax=Channa striata TaxID=64152 RepID=A0AA88MD32_CHASR|nr:hypothetical protein Q5P01_015837 [Channa striata]
MCWDSMMKLKGFEAAARKQGKHKQRVWLKVSSSGVRIVDERTGAVLHDHERSRISSLTKDESDPRALAYIYQDQDTYSLYYIKTSNLADPVLADINEVCQSVDQETPQIPAETVTQTHSLLLLNESSASPPEASSRNELLEVFSFQAEGQPSSTQSSCSTQPESPHTKLSTSQILSMFPVQPAGGSPYSSPPYSPTTMPWGVQGPLGNQCASPAAVSPWPSMPSSVSAWPPAGFAASPASPAGSHIQAHCSQPGLMWGGNPPTVNGFPTPLNSTYTPAGATGPVQSASPIFEHNPNL